MYRLAVPFWCGVAIIVGSLLASRSASAKPIAKGTPEYLVTQAEIKRIRHAYSGCVRAKVSEPWDMETTAVVSKLFPQCHFVTLRWDEDGSRCARRPVGLASFLGKTLVIKGGVLIGTLYEHGNYEDFGTLLSQEGVVLKSAADAQDVWNAFCDLHHKEWRDQQAVQISERQWNLGVAEIGDTRYWYEVLLDDTARVAEAKLTSAPAASR